MKEFFKKKSFRILMLVELAVLVLVGVLNLRPLKSLTIAYSQMEYVNGKIEDGLGVYTNETMGMEGYFVYGPFFDIKKGIYEVTIDYESDSDANYILVTGENEDYNSILKDDFTLNSLVTSQTFSVWFEKDIENVAVSVMYGGEGSFLVKGITIKECVSGRLYAFLKTICALTILNLICWIGMLAGKEKISREKALEILFLGALVLAASYPLFTSFLTDGDDIVYHLLRIEGIKDGLLSGQFPVRIQPIQYRGYGYASSIFYGEILLYIPAVLRLCGVPLQDAYKIFVLMVNIATVVVAYSCMQSVFRNKKIAGICCLAYTLAPYRLANIYVRSAVGEYCAMIFWPFIMLGLYQLFTVDVNTKEYKKIWFPLTIGYSGLIQTHLLSCELAAVFSVIICLVFVRKFFRKETLWEIAKFFGTTVLLNLFFLVPLLEFMLRGGVNITEFGSIHTKMIQGNGIQPAQYFNLFVNGHGMSYGHGLSAYKIYGMSDEAGITIGLPLLITFLAWVYFMVVSYKRMKQEKYYRLALVTGVLGAFCIIGATNLFPWDVLCRLFGGLVSTIQFPWRLLSIGTIFLSILLGCVLSMMEGKCERMHYRIFVGVLVGINMISAGYMLYDRLNTSKGMYVYDATGFADKGSGSLDEYAPAETDWKELKSYEPLYTENLTLDEYEKRYTNVSFVVEENEGLEGTVIVPLLSYDGYEAEDESGNPLFINKTDNGVLTVRIPAGYEGSVNVFYAGKWYWRVAEMMSVITLIIFLALAIKSLKRPADIKND